MLDSKGMHPVAETIENTQPDLIEIMLGYPCNFRDFSPSGNSRYCGQTYSNKAVGYDGTFCRGCGGFYRQK